MSKVQWLGQVRPPQPEPVHPVIANAEKMIALAGGPRVEHLGEPADDGSTWAVTWTFLSMAGAALAAYHGYKRNHESTGAAVGWGVLGGLFPIITVPVALAQGYGKPAGASDNPSDYPFHFVNEGQNLYRVNYDGKFVSTVQRVSHNEWKWESATDFGYSDTRYKAAVASLPLHLFRKFKRQVRDNPANNPESFEEVAKFTYAGTDQTYEAGGAFYSKEHGVLAGYPSSVNEKLSGADAPPYELRQWDGKVITPLRLVSKHRGGFGRGPMYAWSAVYDGRVFHGRNSGLNMLLRMRAGRKIK